VVGAQVAVVEVAAGCCAAACTLGALVGAGVVDSSGFRWAHHALFGVTVATTLVAASSALWARPRPGLLLAPALVAWAVLPRVPAPSRRHVALACAAAPWYALALRSALGPSRRS
jgi:hypothetical protein